MSTTGLYRERQFGPAADALVCDLTAAHVTFFDRWLRGRTDALDGTAPVRIFVMGIDQWRDELDWPLPDTTYVDYHLDGAGAANFADGDGVLCTDAPLAEAADSYTYDPAQPVPTRGGRIMLPAVQNAVGPVDQRPVEARDDVLCLTTPVLDEPFEVTGQAEVARTAGAHEVLPVVGFRDEVRRLTGGRGVDVVVDPVGGDRFTDSLRSLATEGRLIVLGFTGGAIPTVKVNRLLLTKTTVLGAASEEFWHTEPGFVGQQWRGLLPLMESGGRRPADRVGLRPG